MGPLWLYVAFSLSAVAALGLVVAAVKIADGVVRDLIADIRGAGDDECRGDNS